MHRMMSFSSCLNTAEMDFRWSSDEVTCSATNMPVSSCRGSQNNLGVGVSEPSPSSISSDSSFTRVPSSPVSPSDTLMRVSESISWSSSSRNGGGTDRGGAGGLRNGEVIVSVLAASSSTEEDDLGVCLSWRVCTSPFLDENSEGRPSS